MGRLAPYWQRLRGAHLPTPATEIAQRQEQELPGVRNFPLIGPSARPLVLPGQQRETAQECERFSLRQFVQLPHSDGMCRA